MCGRYTLAASLDDITARFDAVPPALGESGAKLWDWQPRYNIAPASVVPVVAFNGAGQRAVVPMRWGLHPSWRKEPPEGRPLFNARVETAAEKPSFRTPFKRRRALIPTTGWYEWERVELPNGKTGKTPHFIFEDGEDVGAEIFAFAGLWERWRVQEGIELLSCTILTTPAQGDVKHLHHRMPVRLPEAQWDRWLDADVNPEFVLQTLRGGGDLGFYEVDKAVGNARNLGPDLIKPAVDV
jgi:putative SOS response-associated peptidase YedK